LNWDRIQSQARQLGIERILQVTLLLANRLLTTAIPPQIENTILADKAAHAFTNEIAVSVAAGVTYEDEQLSYFRLMMRLRERADGSNAIPRAPHFHSWSQRMGSSASA